ncbi:STN domain-containing protein [Bordetella genomosp. 13]|uniref:Secretin/TonB short N-terminal domain-containing protein n=1 Tax=Bordetella genomosp. 13 TaxID=463040 RepID=A0A1W6Z7D9_9BORD|nr:STN domain-containing protein [Bordetella genomosp. 13]ARP93298.1 hypothetical protein CAL15_02185 [Bordetella genomosp. 13]
MASAQDFPSGPTAREIDFNIEAQPLEDAVEQFSAITGISVVYQASLSVGRSSVPVSGRYLPDTALRMMVSNAQLNVRRTAEFSYVITSAPPASSASTARQWRSASEKSYYGLVQRSLRRALCANARVAPASYRAALQFWIDPLGHIDRVHLLDTTGDPQRDDVLRQTLTGLTVAPPPQELPQPVLMVLLPREQALTADCHAG